MSENVPEGAQLFIDLEVNCRRVGYNAICSRLLRLHGKPIRQTKLIWTALKRANDLLVAKPDAETWSDEEVILFDLALSAASWTYKTFDLMDEIMGQDVRLGLK